ncbi:MAG: EndoU domain-containing protein [Alphaproteobacteria bacterium]|nr:EndoU domain-containing protein [Alphaproteobacteria bacterium]
MPPRAYITPERRKHILEGDATGGGHRAGAGKLGKSEFPMDWSDDKIIKEIEDVANDTAIEPQLSGDRIVKMGTRDGVDIKVVIDPRGEIVTGYPTDAS